ncbi:MAG: MBL fold metallo-hydrolase [Dehalococcoidales bacterium]|nr:MAG: MBL fold metallo-hydrolase [Dehalococcoidales bacterium]
MVAREIIPGVYQLTSGGTNLFVIAEEELTLIDTGLPGSSTGIAAFVRRIGRSVDEISSIIITHNHIDHIGAVPELCRFNDIEIIAHKADLAGFDTAPSYPHGVRRLLKIPFLHRVRRRFVLGADEVDIQLEGGEALRLLGGLRVVPTPGHTPGSICLYAPGQKLMFVGDALQRRRKKLRLPAKMVSTDLVAAVDSVKKMAELDLDIICFGHGKPLFGDAHSRLLALVERSGG